MKQIISATIIAIAILIAGENISYTLLKHKYSASTRPVQATVKLDSTESDKLKQNLGLCVQALKATVEQNEELERFIDRHSI